MKINFTDQEILIVGKALSLMPYGEVVGLLANIQTQINEQQVKNDTAGTEPEAVE